MWKYILYFNTLCSLQYIFIYVNPIPAIWKTSIPQSQLRECLPHEKPCLRQLRLILEGLDYFKYPPVIKRDNGTCPYMSSFFFCSGFIIYTALSHSKLLFVRGCLGDVPATFDGPARHPSSPGGALGSWTTAEKSFDSEWDWLQVFTGHWLGLWGNRSGAIQALVFQSKWWFACGYDWICLKMGKDPRFLWPFS